MTTMTTMTTETAIQIQVSRHKQTLVDTSRQIVTWIAFAILAMFHRGATTWSPVFLRWMTRQKEDEQMFTSLDIPLSFTVLIPSKLYYVSTSQFSFSNLDKRIQKVPFQLSSSLILSYRSLQSQQFRRQNCKSRGTSSIQSRCKSKLTVTKLIGIIGPKSGVVG